MRDCSRRSAPLPGPRRPPTSACRSSRATSGTAPCGRCTQTAGRRGHPGVPERAVAWLLRHDGDPDAGGTRLHAHGSEEEPAVAIVNRRFAEHYFKGKSAIGKRLARAADRTPADDRDHRCRRELPGRGPARRRPPAVFWRGGERAMPPTMCAPRPVRPTTFNTILAQVREMDTRCRSRAEDGEGQLDETLLTDRLIALLSAALRRPRDAARVDRTVWCDGVRRRPPPEGAGRTPRLGAQPTASSGWVMRKCCCAWRGLAIGIPTAIVLARASCRHAARASKRAIP